jgi:hypothetical protein
VIPSCKATGVKKIHSIRLIGLRRPRDWVSH